VRLLTVAEAAYLAGLIDGEGTVTLSRKHAGEMRQLVVSISNTELSILEFALRSVGAGKLTRKRTSKAHHTPSHTYALWNRQALSLLAQVEPYMRSYKRDRAQLVLRDYVRLTPRNGKYTEALHAERTAFEDRVLTCRAVEDEFARGWRTAMERRVGSEPPTLPEWPDAIVVCAVGSGLSRPLR
jgi:hypothetical protein